MLPDERFHLIPFQSADPGGESREGEVRMPSFPQSRSSRRQR